MTEVVSAEEVTTTEKVEQVAYYERGNLRQGTIPADENCHKFAMDADEAARVAKSHS